MCAPSLGSRESDRERCIAFIASDIAAAAAAQGAQALSIRGLLNTAFIVDWRITRKKGSSPATERANRQRRAKSPGHVLTNLHDSSGQQLG